MTIKKMMLLASMALAAVAFAVPTTASAQATWTDNGVHLGVGQHATEVFEGFFKFTTPAPPVPVHTTFGCQVAVKITAVGPRGGKITEFSPTTGTCEGTGVFAGCVLQEDFSNVTHEAEEELFYTWNISLAGNGTGSTVTHSGGGNLTRHNVYAAGCTIPGTHLEFASISAVPTVSEGTITSLLISGTATNGFTVLSGSFTPESAPALGIAGIT